MPVYDEKYIKAKVREFNGMIKTNFLGDKVPKETMHYFGTLPRQLHQELQNTIDTTRKRCSLKKRDNATLLSKKATYISKTNQQFVDIQELA